MVAVSNKSPESVAVIYICEIKINTIYDVYVIVNGNIFVHNGGI